VGKRSAKVYSVLGPDGKPGFIGKEGQRFTGAVVNASGEPIVMHWHGQVKAPALQDRARPDGQLMTPQTTDQHDFELTPGTHWMHSHTLAEQQLLAAPMIAVEKDAPQVQEVVIMLHDFSFKTPEEILAALGGSGAHGGMHGQMGHMPAGSMPMQHTMGAMGHMMTMVHANDVPYDAYLANDRTFDDPEVVNVDKGSRVRLRIINGGTATAFFISTPGLKSQCIAVDGNACKPLTASAYPMAQGQRLDLMVDIPTSGGAFPIVAQVESAAFQTGIVLATAGARIAKLSTSSKTSAPAKDLAFDSQLSAATPLAVRKTDRSFVLMLGEEPGYRWTINGAVHGEGQPLEVKQGQRVELTFMNPTMMMHPMHLHGHHFQVVAIGGKRLTGPLRDVLIVPPHFPVTIAFDAGLPGSWFLHCHHLYHMATGMMTELRVA
jgi:FtsP/CotA-like multicopper oxidase with cupredoxin domain